MCPQPGSGSGAGGWGPPTCPTARRPSREWRQSRQSQSEPPRERLPPCHKLGTARTSASVVFFGFRESSCTGRRQSAPRFFPPGNQCGSRRPPVSLRKSRLCVLHPAIPPRKFHSSSRRAASDEEVGANWAWPRAGGVTGCFGAAPGGVPGFLGRAPLKRRPQRGVVGRAQPGARGAGEGRRLLLPQKLAWKVLYLFLFIHEKWQ